MKANGDTPSYNNNCLKFSVFFTFLIVIVTFGTFSILQWMEIVKLNDRIAILELHREIHVQKREQKQLYSLNADGSFTEVLNQLVEEISRKQTDILSRYCVNSSKVCLPGPPGPKGDTGEKGEDGKRGPKGEPGHTVTARNSYRGYRDLLEDNYANSCCYQLAKPVLQGRTDITMTAARGTDIILPCKPTGLPPADIHWSPAVDPRQLGRYIQTVDGLLIKTTDFTDTTTFTCHTSNVFGNADKTIHLIVTEPIQVSVTPPSTQLNANQSVDFTCSFSGIPPPIVKWYHVRPDKVRESVTSGITTTSQQSVLHIDNIGALSSGQYQCQVYNSFENKTSLSNLNVLSKPFIINGPKTQLVNARTTVTLRCDVVGNPPSNVAWTFPKTGSIPPKTASINPDGSVTLFHVDSFSEGTYTCTATNSKGSTTSSGVLNVNVPLSVTTSPHEKALKTGESFVQLTCHSSGGGKTTLSWSKLNSSPLSTNPGKYLSVGDGLIITGVNQATDSGVYVCNGTDGKQTTSDKVILYKDMGQLTCSSNFSDCGVGVGGACGGTCPGNCRSGNIYGYKRYTLSSLICLSAEHSASGGLSNSVMWTVEHSTNTFEPKMSNGITSQYSGPVAQEAVFWTPQQPNIPSLFG